MAAFAVPGDVAQVIDTLEAAGHEAWLVGGCVRDLLLGLEPHDYDIACSALPDQVQTLFEHTVPTGERYGTVTVLTGRRPVEVTTFRLESGYADHRRPDRVVFALRVREDLSRRDFTVNAMAWHPGRGLFDPFGGQRDLQKRLIRAVGDPAERFREDPLRILRAFRFMAQHGLTQEPATLSAAVRCAPLVAKISGERVRAELQRLLCGRPSAMAALVRIGALDYLGVCHDNIDRMELLDGVTDESFPPVSAWAAFLWLARLQPDRFFGCLHFDNRTRGRVNAVLDQLRQPLPRTPAEVKQRLRRFGAEIPLFDDALRLCALLLGRDAAAARGLLREVLAAREPYCLSMLAVTGGDLIAAGIVPPGPQTGRLLRALLDHVTETPRDNSKNVLLELAKSLL